MNYAVTDSDYAGVPPNKVFWAAKTMQFDGFEMKRAIQVKSDLFFCPYDPLSAQFQITLGFGVTHGNYLDVAVGPVNKDVILRKVKFSLDCSDGRSMTLDDGSMDILHGGKICRKRSAHVVEKLCQLETSMFPTLSFTAEIEYEDTAILAEDPYEYDDDDEDVEPRSPKVVVKPFQTEYLKLLETGKDADVTFNVNGEKMKAHQMILSAQSAYFTAMFETDMREGLSKEVEITDAEPELFRALLRYVYAGIEPPIPMALDMLVLADKYGLEHLKKYCEGEVIVNFFATTDETEDMYSVVDALLVAERLACEHLLNRAMAFLTENFDQVSDADRAKLKTDPDLLLKIFGHCFSKRRPCL